MNKKKREEIIRKLLAEIEEEDIGISLLTTFYQNKDELAFFRDFDRERVQKILQVLSDDSKRHKELLEKAVTELAGRNNHENGVP